ncbi:MAG: hydrogenase/urease nickel incorporation protein HypA [Sulfurimonas sp.]
MHEYSIISSLLDLCREHAAAHEAKRVLRVEVKIGVLSGVEPPLLERAFETFKERSICEDAKFVMHLQPLKIRCKLCLEENELRAGQYNCPVCKSTDVEVTDGEEMHLMRLELE